MGFSIIGGKSVGDGVIEGVGVAVGRGVIVGIVGVILGSAVARTAPGSRGTFCGAGVAPGPGVKVAGSVLVWTAVSSAALVGNAAKGIIVGNIVPGVQAVVNNKKRANTKYQYKRYIRFID